MQVAAGLVVNIRCVTTRLITLSVPRRGEGEIRKRRASKVDKVDRGP